MMYGWKNLRGPTLKGFLKGSEVPRGGRLHSGVVLGNVIAGSEGLLVIAVNSEQVKVQDQQQNNFL